MHQTNHLNLKQKIELKKMIHQEECIISIVI